MIHILSLRTLAKQSRYWIAALAFSLIAMTFCVSSFAQDEVPIEEAVAEEEGSTYSPEPCEFSITFPDEPYTARRCEDEEMKRCFDLVSYTQVYELSSTVNFRVICNRVDADLYKDYSPQVMEATLRAMTKSNVIDEYNSEFREEEGYKQAGLAGSGKVGTMPTIYIAQLWIGKQSVFSLEAELIGQAHEAADKLFSDILKSVHYSGVKAEEEAPKKKAKAKPSANN
ncbi:MAG: hypothetical protein R3E13_00865 [Alphaproteobacteria bacterium]